MITTFKKVRYQNILRFEKIIKFVLKIMLLVFISEGLKHSSHMVYIMIHGITQLNITYHHYKAIQDALALEF